MGIWPVSGATYQPRTPIWEQPWSWSIRWIAEAARHNTIPAVILRGAAMAATQAALIAACIVQGLSIGLLILGVFPW